MPYFFDHRYDKRITYTSNIIHFIGYHYAHEALPKSVKLFMLICRPLEALGSWWKSVNGIHFSNSSNIQKEPKTLRLIKRYYLMRKVRRFSSLELTLLSFSRFEFAPECMSTFAMDLRSTCWTLSTVCPKPPSLLSFCSYEKISPLWQSSIAFTFFY